MVKERPMLDPFGANKPVKILIVEDEAIIAEDIAETLRNLGYEVAGIGQTGAEAIRMAEQHRPDLILMDVKLQEGIDGIETAHQIRSRMDIPFVYLTAYAEPDVLERAKKTHPYGFLGKPIGLLELRNTLENALYKHHADKRVRESEERLRLAWETIADALAISRARDGIFVDINRGFSVGSGYSREEVLGKSSLDIPLWHDPASRQLFLSLLQRDGQVRDFETKMRRKDGKIRSVLMSGTQMMVNGELHILSVSKEVEDLHQAAEALRASEEKYRQIFDNALEGIFQTTPDGRLISANQALARIFGYGSPEEMVNQVTDIASQIYARGEEREDIKKRVEDADPLMNQEVEFRGKDGTPIWVSINAHAVPDENGKVLYYEGTAEDITARKRAEEALRESEERYRSVFNNAAVGITLKSPDGTFLEVNQAVADILGYDRSELVGMSARDVTYPDDVRVSRKMHTAVQRGGIDTYRIEKRCLSKDGRLVWVDTSVTALRDTHGKLRATVDIIADTTDRKNAEEALRESEERLSQIINFLPDATFAIDREGRVIAWNRAIEEMTGVSAGEMIGMGNYEYALPFYGTRRPILVDLVLKPDEGIRQSYSSFRADNNILTIEAEHAMPLGKKVTLWGMAAPLFDVHGNVVGAIESIRDITERKNAEEALRESEGKFSTAFRSAPNPMMISSPNDGTIIEVNDAFVTTYGYERSELLNKTTFELGIWKDAEERASWLRQIVKEGYARNVEMSVSKKDGRLRQCLVSTVTFQFQGKPFLLGTFNDVTDRKRAEAALRERERTMRSILVATPVGLCLTENHFIKWANAAWERMFGFTDESEYVGWPTSIMYGTEAQYLAERETVYRNLASRTVGETYTDLMRRDGARFRGHLRSTFLDSSDPSKGMVSAISDLTEITRSEQARRESEERYRVLFEDSIDAVFVTDQDGNFIEANRAFCVLFAYERNELEGLTAQKTYADPNQRRVFQEAIEKTGSIRDFPIQFRKKDGTVFEGFLTASVRYGVNGDVLGFQGIIRDMTERRQLEKQLQQAQKLEAIGTLAAGVAHDFNNILTVIQGFSELLLVKTDENALGYSQLRKIHEAGRIGAELVRNLLTFSRKADTYPRSINLNEEVVRIENLLRRTIPKMIKIELHLEAVLAAVNADPDQMGQVLMNLALNAQHAMPDGGTLTIATSNIFLDEEYCRSHPQTLPGSYVLLTVADTGHGMDKEVLEHIFEPFFTTKGVGKGTGLGLAMVYGIVSQHGGHITCYSEPGHGTTFKIYLPAIAKIEFKTAAEPEQVLPRGGTETILLVDDEDIIRNLGESFLTMAGYTVLIAASGPEAIQLYLTEGERISLVILDLIMPEMGGEKCLEEILAIDPEAKIIISSGTAIEGKKRETFELGAKAFVTKPFLLGDMLKAVREVLDQG
jgi:two-component system, cell cycle sensor histidine kinase and response regulator CckA